MATLTNGLQSIEEGATAWRLIVNDNFNNVYSKSQLESLFVKKSGSTLTGALILNGDPTADLEAATKQYVDSKVTLEAIQDLLSTSFVSLDSGITIAYDDTNDVFNWDVVYGTSAGTVAEGNHNHNNLYTETLTAAKTIDNLDSYSNLHFTLGADITLNNPTTMPVGLSGTITLQQDSTGNRLVTWDTYFTFSGGTAPTLSTAVDAIDSFNFIVLSSTNICIL